MDVCLFMYLRRAAALYFFFRSFGTRKFSPKRRLVGSAERHVVPDHPLPLTGCAWIFLLIEARASVGLATTATPAFFATPAIILASFLSHSPSFAPRSESLGCGTEGLLARLCPADDDEGGWYGTLRSTFGFGAFVSTSAFVEGTTAARGRLL